MDIKINSDGTNNVDRIRVFNPDGISVDYKGDVAKEIIQLLGKSLSEGGTWDG